jgi:pimeloyl-ACP methyl ester carboxylesterase
MPTDALLLSALSDAVRAAVILPPRILLPEDHYVQLNGVRFHYLDWGNAHLPHVLLLHGDGLQAHTWDLGALLLRDSYHLVALSLRGHGDSGWTPDSELERDRLDLLLEDTRAFVEHLGYAQLALVGMSLGGLAALRFAAQYPEQLTALAVLDVAPELELAGLAELARHRSAAEILETFDAFLEGAHRLLPSRPIEQLRYSLLHALRQLPDGRWTWKRDLRPTPALSEAQRVATTAALWRDARAIRASTLVLRGELSKILAPEVAARFVRELSQARLVVIPHAGHNLHGDAPAAFASALDEFLRAAATPPLP